MANPHPPDARPKIGDLLHDIGRDVRTIAGDELQLVRHELTAAMHRMLFDAIGTALGAVVALIGLGFLCTAAVAGLAPVLPALWLRLLIMAVVYVVLGGLATVRFADKMKSEGPVLEASMTGARRAIEAVEHGLEH